MCRAALIAGVVAVLDLVGPVPAASAHATLLFTTPAVDGAVPSTPQQIQLVFDQPVRPLGSSLLVTLFRTTYGQWLVAKLALVTVIAGLPSLPDTTSSDGRTGRSRRSPRGLRSPPSSSCLPSRGCSSP
jgi:hypothetical protein